MLDSLHMDCAREHQRIVRFVREQAAEAGFSRLLLGVSGGVDSALVAALCADAVGPENVLGLMMPYRTSSPLSEAHGRLVIDQLGIKSERVDITPMVDAFCARFPDMTDGRRGNIMARCRMMVLYDQSVVFGGLVAGTSNRTETLLGYFTLFGDGAAAFKPIEHLFKCQVNMLASHVRVPPEVVEKAPSADLWAGQTDEGELGFTYDEADAILYLLTEAGITQEEAARQGYSQDTVVAIARRMRLSEFKRRWPPALPAGSQIGPKGANA